MLVNCKIIEFTSTGWNSFPFIDVNNKKYLIVIYYRLLNNVLIMNEHNKS
jgi:hypothetical protein